jgi:hypothetical protein
MNRNKLKWIPFLLLNLILFPACAYIVTPEPETTPTSSSAKGWNAMVTNVQTSADGLLHIDLAVRNDTENWSAMQADQGKPAVLTTSDGKNIDCSTVFVGTGENRIPPGFQIKGYTAGTKMEPKTQLLYVECPKGASAENAKLAINYSYVTGAMNYYVSSKSTSAKMELNLNDVAKDLSFPVAAEVTGLIEKPGNKILAINNCELTLSNIRRTDTGFEFTWDNSNPSKTPTYVHIGMPPVIGSDGIIYGFYQSPHLADAPITPDGGKSTWKTTVIAPKEIKGYYLLVAVESKQQRLFVSHVIDLTDK